MNSSNTFYFLMGLGIGAVAGILYAPKSGYEARDFLKSKSSADTSLARQCGKSKFGLSFDALESLRRKASTATSLLDQLTAHRAS
jgi:gas vesicle protein